MVKTLSCAGIAVLLAGAAITLSACDGGAASTAARDHTAATTSAETTVATADSRSDLNAPESSDRADPRDQPVALVDGKPMWAANKRHTAEENATYQFQRDGADFGANNLQDFIKKAHAFTASPPKGALSLTRSNGDKLLYDPKANIFAVVTKEGAPRAMFKPTAGMAYWQQQVARQADDNSSDSSRSYSRRSSDRQSSDDEG